MIELLIATALLSAWTAGWLHWMFQGHLRQFFASRLFPESWLSGRSRQELAFMDEEEFTIFLAAECQAHPFVRGVLGCPVCLSAHVAGAGSLLLLFAVPLLLLPLVWAGAAYAGHRLHTILASRPSAR